MLSCCFPTWLFSSCCIRLRVQVRVGVRVMKPSNYDASARRHYQFDLSAAGEGGRRVHEGPEQRQLQTLGSHRAYDWCGTPCTLEQQLQLQLYSLVPLPSPLCLGGAAHFNCFCHSKLIKSEHSEWKCHRQRRLRDAVHSLDTNNSRSVASVAKSKTEADRREARKRESGGKGRGQWPQLSSEIIMNEQ